MDESQHRSDEPGRACGKAGHDIAGSIAGSGSVSLNLK
jgi:hypothetical protein